MNRFVVALLVAGALAGGVAIGSGLDDAEVSPSPAVLAGDDADIGFLQDMTDHHGQAVLLSSFVLRNGEDPNVRNLARNIYGLQAYERGQMAALLDDRGAGPGAADRVAMAWMPERYWCSTDTMPGMVNRAELNEFFGLEGAELDRRFVELMLTHHEGGVFMAEQAASRVSDPRIESLARSMAVAQQGEITDLRLLLGP